MKKLPLAALMLLSLTLVFCKGNSISSNAGAPSPVPSESPAEPISQTSSADELECLVEAYPDILSSNKENVVSWSDGTSMIFDDGKTKANFEDMLNHASLKDQMATCYAPGDTLSKAPAENDDPGRARYEPFFLKMYGNSPDEVKKHLVQVIWLPKHLHKVIMVTTVNAIDQKMKAISDELDSLPDEYVKYLENPGGTFNWRPIAGTNRLSTHSFGSTIDINVKLSDYWRDFKPDAGGHYSYRNRIPMRIVEIFEKHGFIWGGKWYHFDTMHFEYRPELLAGSCVCR